ncbi:hypothetical protein HNP46_000514 [Pseudomonas nitritireducens]|uniref:Uncharacterized protein n=1 Tax=Pseudomonas nitroreducens TaxID=46680 RepID=A0A7W7KG82_PSENT|nr:hypothetical protein [Pseudomonas nitritireducens]MBB4861703.1 hypothetical protein [Pseudomonas nitritireducens]
MRKAQAASAMVELLLAVLDWMTSRLCLLVRLAFQLLIAVLSLAVSFVAGLTLFLILGLQLHYLGKTIVTFRPGAFSHFHSSLAAKLVPAMADGAVVAVCLVAAAGIGYFLYRDFSNYTNDPSRRYDVLKGLVGRRR